MTTQKTLAEFFRQFAAYELERLRGLQEERAQTADDLQKIVDATAILSEKAKNAALDAKLDLTKIQRLQSILDENPDAVVDVDLPARNATRGLPGKSDPLKETDALTAVRRTSTTDA
jgi:hypothetical protein